MRKEVVFAIIIGLILGFVILLGIQLANQSTKQAISTTITPTPTTEPNIISPDTQKIIIASPTNHAVVNTSSIKITGKFITNSAIAISNSEDDTIVTTDQNGNFSADLKLTGGDNTISITALKPDLTTDTTKITVIYTTAKLTTPTPTVDSAPIASNSQEIVNQTKEDILKKAQDRFKETEENLVTKAENILVGYAGTISDIRQGVFGLNTDDINLQVSYSSTSAILKDNKPLKPELISLKDHAIVIGNLSSPDILSAKRIVITSATSTINTNKKVILSPIVKIKTNSIVLKIDNKDQEIALGKKLKLDLKTLTTNNKIFGIILTEPATLLQAKIL